MQKRKRLLTDCIVQTVLILAFVFLLVCNQLFSFETFIIALCLPILLGVWQLLSGLRKWKDPSLPPLVRKWLRLYGWGVLVFVVLFITARLVALETYGVWVVADAFLLGLGYCGLCWYQLVTIYRNRKDEQ